MSELTSTQQQFNQGDLPKPEYISTMYSHHQRLFEYAEFIKKTDIEKIEIMDGQLVMTSRQYGIRVQCDPTDMRTAPIETLNFSAYEPNELNMLTELLSNHMTTLDIGANIGWYSMAMASQFPQSQFHAFEPIPKTYETLTRNIELNQFSSQIHTYPSGFSDEVGETTFYFARDMGVNASMRNVAERSDDAMTKTICPIDTVDNFTETNNLTIDFIKCDVEGAEYLVFKGAKATLMRDKPIIFSELLRKWSANYDYHPNEMLNYLNDLGYDCFCSNEQRQPTEFKEMTEQSIETNFFFLHREKHQDLIKKYVQHEQKVLSV